MCDDPTMTTRLCRTQLWKETNTSYLIKKAFVNVYIIAVCIKCRVRIECRVCFACAVYVACVLGMGYVLSVACVFTFISTFDL